MKETILLYNFDSAAVRNKIKFLCIQSGIHIRVVEKQQYDVPIGILACGKKEEIASFLRSEESESNGSSDQRTVRTFSPERTAYIHWTYSSTDKKRYIL